MDAIVEQVSVSPGGVPKTAVPSARISTGGVEGDRQRDTRNHGGPERAVCLLAGERIDALQAEGHPIGPGTTGENITTRGIEWAKVQPGTRLQLGDEVVLEVTRYTSPCKNIAGSFADGDFNRMNAKLHPGESRVYARVLDEGAVRPGDAVRLVTDAQPVS
ncbi:MAG: MOSC domain-containing protein [Dehalococcoidia bacterium]|nr:MOSC domain-containing protein [Dehalococcoidia bacterium]